MAKGMISILLILLVTGAISFAQNRSQCLRYSIGSNKELMEAFGADSVGDGYASGRWIWSASSTATDDTVSVQKPYMVTGAGRWINPSQAQLMRQIDKQVTIKTGK